MSISVASVTIAGQVSNTKARCSARLVHGRASDDVWVHLRRVEGRDKEVCVGEDDELRAIHDAAEEVGQPSSFP